MHRCSLETSLRNMKMKWYTFVFEALCMGLSKWICMCVHTCKYMRVNMCMCMLWRLFRFATAGAQQSSQTVLLRSNWVTGHKLQRTPTTLQVVSWVEKQKSESLADTGQCNKLNLSTLHTCIWGNTCSNLVHLPLKVELRKIFTTLFVGGGKCLSLPERTYSSISSALGIHSGRVLCWEQKADEVLSTKGPAQMEHTPRSHSTEWRSLGVFFFMKSLMQAISLQLQTLSLKSQIARLVLFCLDTQSYTG